MASTADITDGVALQQFVLLAKSSKGKACCAVIQKALSAPNVFIFGELLDMPNVQALIGTEDEKMVELLKIFAYGTYDDYRAKSSQLPPLEAPQAKKLKQLSIVTLSGQSKLIPYSVLQKQLDITNLRELEDLIIDAIYQGIIQGSLDQKRQQLEVEFAMGRDIKPESIDEMISALQNWSAQANGLLNTIKDKISHANYMNESEKKHKEEHDKRIELLKQNIKASMEAEMIQAAEFEGSEFFDERGRKGRSKLKGHRDPQGRRM